jgi:hypothetical protein
MAITGYTGTSNTATSGFYWVTASPCTTSTTYYSAVNPYYVCASGGGGASRPFDWRRASAELEKKQLAFDLQHAAAAKRARQLLLSHLSPVQRKTFRRKGWFVVEGGESGKRYRINGNGICANVERLADNDNAVLHRLCAHCEPATIPTCDQLLAQKIKIEFEERDFLRLANKHAA